MKNFLNVIFAVLITLLTASCIKNKAELGTAENPVKLHFVPSVDAKVIEDNSKKFKSFLEQNTPYKFDVTIPQSYVAVIEAFGTKRADVATINTFGYILANQKYGVEAKATLIRYGSSTYQSMFVTKVGSGIKKLEDLNGKKIAFVDPTSASGYILPLKTLKDKKIQPKETVFAQKHDNVISMVYQGQVDAGAAFYSPPENNEIQDARHWVLTQYPDVEKKIIIIELSQPIPNDPIIFRKEMPEEMKTKIVEAMMKFVKTPEGKEAFKAIYGATDLKQATDADYESVRQMIKAVGVDAEGLMKK